MPSPQTRRILLIGLAALVIVSAGAVFAWRSHRVATSPVALLPRLPTQDAVVIGVDFQALRRSGILGQLLGSHTPPEAEYAAFLHDTGFDYGRDLDYVLASFAPDGEFFLIRGAFDWPRLERYVFSQHGSCFDHLCRVSGSTADRKISFFPLAPNVMALAVAPEDTAAARLQQPGPQADIDIPAQPLWLSVSSGALRHSASLPGGAQLFASAMTGANRVSLTVGPAGDGNLEARLEALCRDAQQAGALTGQLQGLTGLLRQAGSQAGQHPNGQADGLVTLLTSGTFHQAGSHVVGNWRIPRTFLDSLSAPANGG